MATAAAVLSEIQPGMPLDDMLEILDAYLVRSMSGRLEGDAVADYRRAEAITDRLLEARQPFEWIPDEQYSLESRLRQLQSTADRIMAQLETGAPRDSMLLDLRIMRAEVLQLRETIARGGTRAPPPLDRLLHGGDTVSRPGQQPGTAQPAAPTGPRPLGTPIRPPDL